MRSHKKHQITVAIDIDDVLVDTSAWVLNELKRHGISFDRTMLTTYRLEDNPELDTSIASKVIDELIDDGITTLTVLPEDHSILRTLSDWCFVDIVTSRPIKAAKMTENWLSEQAIPFRCWRRSSVGSSKNDLAVGYNYLIDDNADACRAFASQGATAYLVDAPWNKTVKLETLLKPIVRVDSMRSAILDIMKCNPLPTNGR